MIVRNHSVILKLCFAHNYNPTFQEKGYDFGLKHYYCAGNNLFTMSNYLFYLNKVK